MTAPWLRDLPGTRWLDRLPAPAMPRLRMPRLRTRGMHHAGPLTIELGGTIPRREVPGRPPWKTAPIPAAPDTGDTP
jgi:hypothetical protein